MSNSHSIPMQAMTMHVKALLQLKSRGLVTVEELASLLDCSIRRVYKVLEGEGDFSADEIRTLSIYLSEIGRNELALLFLSPKYGITYRGQVTTNNDVDDEIAAIVQILGNAKARFSSRNKDKFAAAMADLDKLIRQLQAEGEGL